MDPNKKKANLIANLPKQTNILDDVPIDNSKLELKKQKAIEEIYFIVSLYQRTKVPISAKNLNKIIKTAIKYKVKLPFEVFRTFYDNRENVVIISAYIEDKIFNTFEKLNLASTSDPKFKVKVINLCIKIKKNKIKYTDNEIQKTGQFNDFQSLAIACNLYIWYVKSSECSGLKELDKPENIDQYKAEYNDTIARICNIVNVRLKNPNTEVTSNDGIETDDREIINNSSKFNIKSNQQSIQDSNKDSDQQSTQDSDQQSTQDSDQQSTQDSNQQSTQDSNQQSTQDSNQDSDQESNQDSDQESNQESTQNSNQESTQNSNQESTQNSNQESNITNENTINTSTNSSNSNINNSENETSQINEGFNQQNNINFIDILFIIISAILIFLLFFIFIRYSK
uniref:Uncharacterized protein n=1 Tax=viral metagenome TaxID=1070528 RepID=A0A6C0H0C9_9ZZZZ